MNEPVFSKSISLARRDLLLLLAPYLHRGFQTGSGETLYLETVELSANRCFVAIRSDRHEAEQARLEQALQKLNTLVSRAEPSIVTGMGYAPNGFRFDSFWVRTERSPENGPDEDALDEAELNAAYQKLAALETRLANLAAPRAGLEIYRQPRGRLLLELLDGYCPQTPSKVGLPAIGPALLEFWACLEELIPGGPQDPAGEAIPAGDESEESSRAGWPSSPGPGAPYDDWFDWFHHISDELGYKFTLVDLAPMMGLSHGHVRRLHSNYMAEHDPAQKQK